MGPEGGQERERGEGPLFKLGQDPGQQLDSQASAHTFSVQGPPSIVPLREEPWRCLLGC